jgi:23S rRNA U2552 (ribose-2'-O)-methylase RlmE/FtsJ
MISTNIARPCSTTLRTQEALIKENERLARTIAIWKNKINNQKKWDIAKKYTNEYEFIFSFNNEGVANVCPISRSFFKIVEILTDHRVLDRIGEPLSVASLCEGPGGFIQGIEFVAPPSQIETIYAITLRSTDKRIPDWKVKASDRLRLVDGADRSGNLYSLENIDHFLERCKTGSCNLVTADGGFDFSSDFNSQENDFLRLLLSEVYTGMRAQKAGGCFVIKMFDLFRSETIQLIAILCECYREVYIHKPCTSRPANSERYIVCLNFEGVSERVLSALRETILNKQNIELLTLISEDSFINTMNHVVNANTTYVSTQVGYIERTLRIIQDYAIYDKKKYEQHCIDWCKTYNVPIKQ